MNLLILSSILALTSASLKNDSLNAIVTSSLKMEEIDLKELFEFIKKKIGPLLNKQNHAFDNLAQTQSFSL